VQEARVALRWIRSPRLSPVTGDLIRALEELGRGMHEAAARFHRVDLVAGSAADNRPSGPRVGRPW
jgi:hypothetical protein